MEEENKENRKCPYCGSAKSQHSIGLTNSGSRRYRCVICKRDYTPDPRKWKYTEEERKQALKLVTDGVTGRGVGRQLNMSKANVYRWAREDAKKGTI